jgi:hypothetical protein
MSNICLIYVSQGSKFFKFIQTLGHAVAQLVEALCFKPDDRGFGSQWCYWKFYWLHPFGSAMVLGSDQPLNRNEYQEYFLGCKDGRCLGLKTSPPLFADSKIWYSQPPGTFWVCPDLYRDCSLSLSLMSNVQTLFVDSYLEFFLRIFGCNKIIIKGNSVFTLNHLKTQSVPRCKHFSSR